jgi:hypothetical protein
MKNSNNKLLKEILIIVLVLTAIRQELPKEKDITLPQVSYCRLNLSECEVTEKAGRFVVNVYNSLSRAINKYIRVPIPDKSTSHQIFDSKGKILSSSLLHLEYFEKYE